MRERKKPIWTKYKMRVLHVIPSVALEQGGPSFVIRLIAGGLASAGVAVDIATTVGSGEVNGCEPIEAGVKYLYLRRQCSFYKFSWPLSRWLSINIGSYDLVHIHGLFSFPAVAAAYWAHRRGIPYVVRPLGTLSRWGFENRRPWLKQASFRWIEARILRDAAAVQYTTMEEQVDAERLRIHHRPVVIPNPYEVPANLPSSLGSFVSRFPALAGKTAILFLSRIDRKKGLDLLLPAFAELRRGHPEAALVIAGDGDRALVAQLHDQARELGIENDILWTGFLHGKDKADALQACAVFVLPSYSENFGVAVVEAMAAGLPVVVSDQVGVHREITRAGAGLVCPCSSEHFATAIGELLDNRTAAREMGVRGAVFARENYSLATVTARLIDLYQSILDHPARKAVTS